MLRSAPQENPEDADVPVWAGVIPVQNMLAVAEPAPDLAKDIVLPRELDPPIGSVRLR